MAYMPSDQAFSPAIPSNSDKQCLFTLKKENGSMADLVARFLFITRGKRFYGAGGGGREMES